jgi:glycosyltransferase involved in cell wall biosynthesis
LDPVHSGHDISVVFPCKNEEPTIGEAIDRARRAFSDRDLQVVVPDSSTDRTPEIARELGALVVTPPGLGYGAAYIHGFKHCGGRLIAMADPDGTYDVLEMPGMVRRLEDGGFDMVMGSRLRGEMEPGAMPAFKRYFGNPFLTWMLNLLFGVGVSDAHCGMRVFTREALDRMDLKTTGMEFASEMLVEAKRAGLKVGEVPISYRKRSGAPSKLSSLGDGWRHIRYMLSARFGR